MRLLRPRSYQAEIPLEQLPGLLDEAPAAQDVRTLVGRARPGGAQLWPIVAAHAQVLDEQLLRQLVSEDPASAPALARNPHLSSAVRGQLAVWAVEQLARDHTDVARQSIEAHAARTLEQLAEEGHLSLGSPAGRALISLARHTSEAHWTKSDREARRILLRIRQLSAGELVTLTDACRSDADALVEIARHPSADLRVWQAILVATPRDSTVERLAEIIPLRRNPEMRQLLRRRLPSSPAVLANLCADAGVEEFHQLWLDLAHADRRRAAHVLADTPDDTLRSLSRRDLTPLLHDTELTVRDASAGAIRRLGLGGPRHTDLFPDTAEANPWTGAGKPERRRAG